MSLADHVHLVDIYHSAREQTGDISIRDLAGMIHEKVEIISKDHLSPLMDYKDEVLLFMGAGDIDQIARQFEEAYSNLKPTNL